MAPSNDAADLGPEKRILILEKYTKKPLQNTDKSVFTDTAQCPEGAFYFEIGENRARYNVSCSMLSSALRMAPAAGKVRTR